MSTAPDVSRLDAWKGDRVTQPTRCGWCGALVHDWSIEGPALHYDGVCIGNESGRTERVLADYHHRGYGAALAEVPRA